MVKKDNNPKMKILSEEDVKVIESDPAGLSDYVVYNKVRSAKKTMVIVTILAMGISFAAGLFCGMGWTRESIPNNVVQIKINSEDGAVSQEEGK